MSLTLTEIGEGAWLAVGKCLGSNSTILRQGQDAFLIDTMGSAVDAAALKNLTEQKLKLKVRRILATHYFTDHMAGLTVFPDAEIFAHETFQQTFDREENRTDEEIAFYRRPTQLLHNKLTIRWGAHDLFLFHNPGFTSCMINVDIPSLDLVHGGDTVVSQMVFLPYAKVSELRRAIQKLLDCHRGNLILSHGPLYRRDTLLSALLYLDTLQKKFSSSHSPTLSDCWQSEISPAPWDHDYHQRNVSILRRYPDFFDR